MEISYYIRIVKIKEIMCISNEGYEDQLTIGKKYKYDRLTINSEKAEIEKYHIIENDQTNRSMYPEHLFTDKISEYRELILKELI